MTIRDQTLADLKIQRVAFGLLILLAVIAIVVFGVFGYSYTTSVIDKLYDRQEPYTTGVILGSSRERDAPSAVAALLEVDAMGARNRRALSILATTTWLRFVTVMLGAILMVLGAALVLSRITSDSIQIGLEAGKAKGSFGTTSPGLVMVLFGALLIGWGLYIVDRTSVVDGSLYTAFLGPSGITNPEQPAAPPISDEEAIRNLKEAGIIER